MDIGDIVTIVTKDFVATCRVIAVRAKGEEPIPIPVEKPSHPVATIEVIKRIERATNGG